MHVAKIRSGYTDKAGRRRECESRYLRRTYRDGGKVRHETLANRAYGADAYTPADAARALAWNGPADPGDWQAVPGPSATGAPRPGTPATRPWAGGDRTGPRAKPVYGPSGFSQERLYPSTRGTAVSGGPRRCSY